MSTASQGLHYPGGGHVRSYRVPARGTAAPPVAGPAAARRGIRIAAIGTSLTARAGWCDALCRTLERDLARSVSITVLARPGATTRSMEMQFRELGELSPDVVLIEAATNDAALHRGISVMESVGRVRALILRLRERWPGVAIVVMAMNPVGGLQRLIRPRLDAYSDAHLRVAAELGVDAVDHRPGWRAIPRAGRRIAIPDGLHPLGGAAADIMVAPLAMQIGARLGHE